MNFLKSDTIYKCTKNIEYLVYSFPVAAVANYHKLGSLK